jgi:hypothetical protein
MVTNDWKARVSSEGLLDTEQKPPFVPPLDFSSRRREPPKEKINDETGQDNEP